MNIKDQRPLVSVVIVNWDGLEDTKLCLEYVKKQKYSNMEIIVVDNGSTDDSVEWLSEQKDIILVKNFVNEGFTGGHIAGFNESKGDFILLLNNDAILGEDYIQTAIDYMKNKPQIGALGGKAYLWNDVNPLLNKRNDFYAYQNINPVTAEGIFSQVHVDAPKEVNNVSGSCVLIPRSIIEKVGYLHNPFFAYYEESDLFARMKRAGYKIMYHPDLAIWHANGKTSERKGSGFSYYMMMRNRFRFAVRNFDKWSLLRFIKFYLLMGLVSTIKSVVPKTRNTIDTSYAKAFWYNAFNFPQAFSERKQLSGKGGLKFTYNQQIVREQTPITVIRRCHTKQDVDKSKSVASDLNEGDELIMIVSDSKVISYANKVATVNSQRLRLCIDRGFLNVHQENLGITCAKNPWIYIDTTSMELTAMSVFSLSETVYDAKRLRKRIVCAADLKIKNIHSVEGCKLSPMLIEKQLLVEAGGFNNEFGINDAVRILMGLSVAEGTLLQVSGVNCLQSTPYSGHKPFTEAVAETRSTVKAALGASKKPTQFNTFILQYYRAQQLIYFAKWFVSFEIPARLKLARLRNISLATLRFNVQDLALELKHVRNEVIHNQFGVIDLDSRNARESERLDHLIKHPEETPVFIITRDRLSTLLKLVKWLEKQGFSKIFFVDNDSALPPLIDYLNKTKYQVIETKQNVGHTVLWSSGIIKMLLKDDFYIVSDPDVIPVINSISTIKRLYEIHRRYKDYLKVGLGLKIDDIPDGYELKKEVISWESQFWNNELEPNTYEAGVDTTFALYKPFTYYYFIHPSIRTGEPYTARHLPWYNIGEKSSDEDIFYSLRADQNVNSWNKGKLPERYRKELDKLRQ